VNAPEILIDQSGFSRWKTSLHSKHSRTKRTKFGPSKESFGPREKWGESKKVERRGWGRGKKGTLARKPHDFEKRPLVFTVEFIY